MLLIRHGRSAHVHAGGLLDRVGVEQWRDAYDAAGIADGDEPPAALRAEIAGIHAVAASDLPRAIASAERLASDRKVMIVPLLREVPLAIPSSLPFRVPLAAWAALIHLRWGADILRGRALSANAFERARGAAACAGRRWTWNESSAVACVDRGRFSASPVKS